MPGFEIGIIGAGVHGASAAYHLATQGVPTVVFERGTPAGGPSGKSSGLVRAYYTNAFLAEATRDSAQFLDEFPDRTDGGASGFRRTGGLYLHGADDADDVQRTVEGMTALGIAATLLSAGELAARFPSLDLSGVAIGAWEDGAGYADPAGTVAGLIGAASRRGASVRSHTGVAQIDEVANGVRVTLDDGSLVDVGRLLIAAGPWTGPLAAQVGATLPLTAERHVVAALRDTAASARAALGHILIDVAGGYYSRPLAPDQVLLGPLAPTQPADPDAFAPRIADLEFAWLAQQSVRRNPDRGAAVSAGGWASLYDVSPDWQPVIGAISERVFLDAGTSGHGFKLAPALGEHVARMLLDDPDPRLAQFSPARFAAGDALASGFGTARILG